MSKLPNHFMVSSTDGHLYDTRIPDWWVLPPVRRNYRGITGHVENTIQLKAAIRQAYAWPGGHTLFGVTHDGAALCVPCMRREWRQLVWDYLHDTSTGWRVEAIGSTSNCDEPPVCDHCGKELA